MLIDTHSHIYLEEFVEDVSAVITRAQETGIGKIFLPNINALSVEPMMSLVKSHEGYLYPMIGLHPEDVGDDWYTVLQRMEPLVAMPGNPFIAIGEIGLDYYWSKDKYEEQQRAFSLQVEWACKYDLPLMIHTRSAHREIVDLLRPQVEKQKAKGRKLQGVFHCFGGSAEEARELLTFDGFMLGIGGVATFKKSNLPEVLHDVVPLERIVLETDAPYLAPVPHRGKRNESAFLADTAARVAQIYGVSVEKVGDITSQNALITFPKAR